MSFTREPQDSSCKDVTHLNEIKTKSLAAVVHSLAQHEFFPQRDAQVPQLRSYRKTHQKGEFRLFHGKNSQLGNVISLSKSEEVVQIIGQHMPAQPHQVFTKAHMFWQYPGDSSKSNKKVDHPAKPCPRINGAEEVSEQPFPDMGRQVGSQVTLEEDTQSSKPLDSYNHSKRSIEYCSTWSANHQYWKFID